MKTEVDFAGIKMKNPVTVASGTFGYGREMSEYIDLSKLGAIITKGTFLKPRAGNKAPRVCETASGMMNAIGLENPGIEHFAEEDLPWLKQFGTPIILNVGASTLEEYVEVCRFANKYEISYYHIIFLIPLIKLCNFQKIISELLFLLNTIIKFFSE